MNQIQNARVRITQPAGAGYWGNGSAGVSYNAQEYAKELANRQFESGELRGSERNALRVTVQSAVIDALVEARALVDAAVESAISDFLDQHPEARAARKAS